ncbi:retropepsin-like aspartic protease family protein [Novipirellula artificiosorum]|nr:retropepsin-like aspartic protease [Novipirellula artificiosorum]
MRIRPLLLVLLSSPCLLMASWGVAVEAETEAKYSPDVVAKAEAILESSELRRSGKTITSTATSDLSRSLVSLSRSERELKLIQQSSRVALAKVNENRRNLQLMNARIGELNLQLARVTGISTQANNQMVGLIEASRSQLRALMAERETLKEQLDAERSKVANAETDYAETVLAIRQDYEKLQDAISKSLQKPDVQIAIRVMARNFDTPKEITAAEILKPVNKRIERIEQEIFRESIPLESSPNGSLSLTAVIGNKPVKMIIDSGASLVVLPAKNAVELGVDVPVDSRVLRLVMANGQTISARAVVLPRIRIGEFEAENVEAAILDESATAAEPLLGMSFLGNFKFELNPTEKTISLLRVAPE